jgi:transcriptional regulator with GAF, ATPase, and Fis domain
MSDRDPLELERRIQSLTEKLLGAFEELDFLHSLAGRLASPAALEDLDDYLVGETMAILRADGGWVSRRAEGGALRTSAVRGFPPTVADELNESLLARLVRDGGIPLLVDDLDSAQARRDTRGRRPRAAARTGQGLEADRPRAFLACPLVVSAEALGVIALGRRAPGDFFTAGDGKLLSTLAVQAALYIKNASLLEQLKSEAQSLGRRVRQLETGGRGRPDLSWIRAESAAMKRLAGQVESAAISGATVLLLGESGTGKSLIARILHHMSARRDGPFVEINCGAIPPALIESELFGHARGAFTGADRERTGLIEEAGAGTILLDEVAELPPELQVKLLSVIERRHIRRVGENRDRPVDVRVIAATNADLGAAVRQGRFREDLFYRLNVITLTVPPLRQRREDIVPLAGRFLAELARETNRRIRDFSPAALDALLGYSWPGNVRELRNVVERSLLLKAAGERIERDDLPPLGGIGRDEIHAAPTTAALPAASREFERAMILRALERSGGVVAGAAEILGISRTNLHNKLKRHRLLRDRSWSDERHNP